MGNVKRIVPPVFRPLTVCLVLLVPAAGAQTRHQADMRATANLDALARQPRGRAEAPTAQREIVEPERAVRRRNAAKPATVAPRAPQAAPVAAATVTPVYSGFAGLGDNFTAIPPDTQGAVGPLHVVTMLNTQVLIQSRSGVTRDNYPMSLSVFWSPLGPFNGTNAPFDPRILYDASADRWIASAAMGGETASSALLIATSQSGDPGGVWNYYKVTVGNSNLWGDFPSLGFNGTWVVVSMNMFQIKGAQNYVNTSLYVFSKADLYDPKGAGTHTVFSDDGGEFAAAVDADDTSPDALYLLQAYATDYSGIAGNGSIVVSKLSGPVGSEAFQGGNAGTINIPDPWADTGPGENDFAPQQGTPVRIDSGDSRLGNCVLHNGTIWCAHTVYLPYTVPTRAAAQWFQIGFTGGKAQMVQRGRIDDATNTYSYAYPSIAVNKNDDALIGYTRYSSSEYATVAFSFRTASDPPGAMQPGTIFKLGESAYISAGARSGSNRWGDYSATMVDPADGLSFWTIQEYASTPPANRTGAFGTWWAEVTAPSAGLNCTYAVSSATSRTFEAAGGPGTFTVTTGSGCPWQAASNTNWITITSGSPGVGGGTVAYTVATSNASASRTGTITIAGQTLPVTQGTAPAAGPSFAAQGAVNAASYQPGAIAPGELITIFGSALGPATLAQPAVNSGVVDTIAGGTRVLFDGVAAPMIYALSGQISAVAPFSLTGRTSTQVQVEYLGTQSSAITMPVAASAPAIFAADASGKGQGAILNQDFSVNSPTHPATAGSTVMIYLTGAGAMQAPVTDGALGQASDLVAQAVSVRIGGVDVPVQYAGAAPGLVEGVIQVNAVVPATPGNAVPVDVTVGGVRSSSAITMAVR